MALAAKGSRLITVDGTVYRWRLRRKPTYHQECFDSPLTFAVAEGVDAAYRARERPAVVFVTPPVDGWTLAVLGSSELFEDDGTGSGALDLAALSGRFGEAQKFATYRVVEYHEWQRWAAGQPIRRYCEWEGEIRFDDGERTRAEGNLPHAADLETEDWDAFDLASEDTVMAVAAEWSIDPTLLGDHHELPPTGLLGFIV